MAEHSKIEWTEATFSPWWGCTRISPACQHCYAATFARRFGVQWGNEAVRRIASESYWERPLQWNRRAEREGRRIRVFCGSMCDVFEDQKDIQVSLARLRLMNLIEETPNLFWLLLTKRPGNAGWMLPTSMPRPNVGLGVTVESPDYPWRIAEILKIPAALHFISAEPLLGGLTIRKYLPWFKHEAAGVPAPSGVTTPTIRWVIAGGESGPGARPTHQDWVRSLRDQCAAANVPFFFKQWGKWLPYDQATSEQRDDVSLRMRSCPAGTGDPCVPGSWLRAGKKAAGNLLDGKQHLEIPEVIR